MTASTVGLVLLVLGYVLAVPFTVVLPGFLRLWRRRELWVFVAAQAGALLITVGWALREAWPAAVVNAAWLVGLTIAYLRTGGSVTGRSSTPRPS